MRTLVLLEVTAKEESVDDVIQFFRTHLPVTRSYEGCRDITVYVNEDGRSIVQVQHWDSEEHYQKYLAWRAETGVLSELESMLDGDPSIRFFQSTDV
jgi:quinol monooxygenase YgiN